MLLDWLEHGANILEILLNRLLNYFADRGARADRMLEEEFHRIALQRDSDEHLEHLRELRAFDDTLRAAVGKPLPWDPPPISNYPGGTIHGAFNQLLVPGLNQLMGGMRAPDQQQGLLNQLGLGGLSGAFGGVNHYQHQAIQNAIGRYQQEGVQYTQAEFLRMLNAAAEEGSKQGPH